MRTYLRLLQFIKPHLSMFGLAVLFMLGSTLLGGVQLGAIVPLADRVVTDRLVPMPPAC